jgi:hypothetical protein
LTRASAHERCGESRYPLRPVSRSDPVGGSMASRTPSSIRLATNRTRSGRPGYAAVNTIASTHRRRCSGVPDRQRTALNAPGIPGALRTDGHFVFETRRPEHPAGEERVPRPTPQFVSDGFDLESNSTLKSAIAQRSRRPWRPTGSSRSMSETRPTALGVSTCSSRVDPIGRREPPTSRLLSR